MSLCLSRSGSFDPFLGKCFEDWGKWAGEDIKLLYPSFPEFAGRDESCDALDAECVVECGDELMLDKEHGCGLVAPFW